MHERWRAKFWEKVSMAPHPKGCWEWRGSRLPKGYGRFYPKLNVGLYAHRVSWEIAHGRVAPADRDVMHSCDNPACVNPQHLSLGTRRENVQDMLQKGRGGHGRFPGESHPEHKLTDEQVIAIRQRWAAGGVTQRELAKEFEVSRGLIGHVVRRKAWAHL